MKITMYAFSFLAAVTLLYTGSLSAQDCSSHPLFSNMPNHKATSCENKEFDKLELTVQDKVKKTFTTLERSGEYMQVTFQWEGEWAKRPSPLQIYQNYANAIQQAGGQVLYRPDDANGSLCGKLKKGGDTYWIKVNTDGSGQYRLWSIKEASMHQDVVVTADQIKKGISEEGKVAFYGIYFDTDKASLKPESTPTLQEIGKFLSSNPGMRMYIVGHTDNAGDIQHNMELSKQRAAAVMNELVSKYGVDKGRLMAHGVGPLSPVTGNATEEGKGRNRRVELVKM